MHLVGRARVCAALHGPKVRAPGDSRDLA
ncbi:MAG: hypothetical protein JWQ26_1489, partial [Modestobacter sp.]|nr:hypothetical protein [Modestobacter sp.]